jgi:filamentous hemagglutinin
MSGAGGALNADLYNRQLHPEEREWISTNLKAFEEFYQKTTGQTITDQQASDMLLTAGFQRVDSTAANSAPGNSLAKQFLASAPGDLFYATPAERSNPNIGANADGSLTPEQSALQRCSPEPRVGIGHCSRNDGGIGRRRIRI